VDEIFSPSRNKVVIKSREGKIENSSGSLIYMVIHNIRKDMAMFTINIKSSTKVGRGIMIKNIIPMIPAVMI